MILGSSDVSPPIGREKKAGLKGVKVVFKELWFLPNMESKVTLGNGK
jgi:hypothetical protein